MLLLFRRLLGTSHFIICVRDHRPQTTALLLADDVPLPYRCPRPRDGLDRHPIPIPLMPESVSDPHYGAGTPKPRMSPQTGRTAARRMSPPDSGRAPIAELPQTVEFIPKPQTVMNHFTAICYTGDW